MSTDQVGLIGAFAASVLLRMLFPGRGSLGATRPAGSWWQSFVLKVVLTFILMFVILNVSTGAKEKGIMGGAAIGSVVALEAMFAEPISGASMNPARPIAPAVVSGQLADAWLSVVAPVIGVAHADDAHRHRRGADTDVVGRPHVACSERPRFPVC